MSRLCADFRCEKCCQTFEYYYCEYEDREVQTCPNCEHQYLKRVYTPWIVHAEYPKDGTVHRVLSRIHDKETGKTTEHDLTTAVQAGKV